MFFSLARCKISITPISMLCLDSNKLTMFLVITTWRIHDVLLITQGMEGVSGIRDRPLSGALGLQYGRRQQGKFNLYKKGEQKEF